MSATALGKWCCAATLISFAACGPPKIDPPTVKPNARNLTLECPRHAVGAFDSSRGLLAGQKLDCTAHVADLVGIGLPNIPVTVMTEAGRVISTGMTGQDGSLSITYETGMPLPADTDPMVFQWNALNDDRHTGQQLVPLWMDPGHWTVNPLGTLVTNNPAFNPNNLQEPRRRDPLRRTTAGMMPVNNPRDNLVTLIAVVQGEEAFIDKNGNGTFDTDEEPTDITEPFVDYNDNGTYDEAEQYVDSNGNGLWDGKNSQWDHDSKIWVQERILWTGVPDATADLLPPEPVVRLSAGQMALNCPTTTAGDPCAQAGPPQTAGIYIADPWFNALARNGANDGCSVDADPTSPVAVRVTSDANASYPAGYQASAVVSDVRDPMVASTQVATRSPPLQFSRTLTCRFSTSSEGGQVMSVTLSVAGTIQ